MITRDNSGGPNMVGPSFPVRLIGEMWWDDVADRAALEEFVLFADRFYFAVKADGWRYQGTLDHLDGSNYKGTFWFPHGGTGIARCTLVQRDGEYRLQGKWEQSDIKGTSDWNAVLEPK